MNTGSMHDNGLIDWSAVWKQIVAIFVASGFANWAVMLRENMQITRAQKAGAIILGSIFSVLAWMWLKSSVTDSLKLAAASLGLGMAFTYCYDIVITAVRKRAQERLEKK